jgi:hypothetical protein
LKIFFSKDRTFADNYKSLRNPSISTLSDLMYEFYAPNMATIEELGTNGGSETPKFIVDEVDSEHNDNNNDINYSNDDNKSYKSVKINNNYIRNDIKQGNFDNPLIKYLLEPPTERRSKPGSICSSVSGNLKSIFHSNKNRSLKKISTQFLNKYNLLKILSFLQLKKSNNSIKEVD